jgi:hypothetical protein
MSVDPDVWPLPSSSSVKTQEKVLEGLAYGLWDQSCDSSKLTDVRCTYVPFKLPQALRNPAYLISGFLRLKPSIQFASMNLLQIRVDFL